MDDFITDDLADLGVCDLLDELEVPVPVLYPATAPAADFSDEG